MWSDFIHRARAILRRKVVEREMDDELRFHIARQAEKYISSGLSAEDAARRARLDFGAAEQVREEYRDSLGISVFETIIQDARYTLRAMRANPAFALIAILSLALAIGANTSIFSLINALMLRDLPVANPEKLVEVGRLTQYGRGNFSYPIYERIRDQNAAFSGVLAMSTVAVEAATVDNAEHPALGRLVSQNFFELLGIAPAAGRFFSTADDPPHGTDGSMLTVISHRFWQREFGGNPSIIGKMLDIQTVQFTIVGVLPPWFEGLVAGRPDDFFIPVASEPRILRGSWLDKPDFNWLAIIGRLKPGVSEQAAKADLDGIFASFLQEFASGIAEPEMQRRIRAQRLTVQSARAGLSALRQELSRPALLLLGAVSLVLLIACANVAGLLLTRGMARRREIAVRIAIGASRRRLIQQLLTESAALGLIGGLIGLVLARWGGRIIAIFIADGNPAISFDLNPDGRVLLFTAVISLAAALFAGMGPAFRSTRANPAAAMRGDVRIINASRTSTLWTRGLIAGQVALSLVLLIGASLLLTSLRNLLSLDTGFDRDHVLLVSINPDRGGCTADRCLDYYRQALERTRHTPGVRATGLSLLTPISGGAVDLSLAVEGRPREPGATVYVNDVSDGYFAALGTPLLVGRDFVPQDGPDSPPVAVINDALARRFFKNENPIGRRVSLGKQVGLEIVGVVANAKYMSLREEDAPTIYVDALQRRDTENLILAVGTYGNPVTLAPAIRGALQALPATARIRNVSSLSAQIDRSLSRERLMMRILTGFAGVALLLTSVGLYGALAFAVTRRTSEIGLRLALGETHASVLWSVLREAWVLVAIGVAIGLPAAFALTRLLSSLLYGVTPTDPWVLARAVTGLFMIALVAALQPAWRALRIDPLVALRYE